MNDVAAIILAAGRARRMGKFKPLLLFGNKTVIETVVDNFHTADIEKVVVVTGQHGDDVRQRLNDRSVTLVTNPNPDSEMSVSIALGLLAIDPKAKAVLITPVDHPAVPSEIVGSLIENWRGGAKLIQPEFEGKGGHPVLIDLSFRNELSNLDSGEGLRGFFEKHRAEVLRLPVDSPFIAQDMDTWDDYVRLHEAVFSRKPEENQQSDDLNG
jgi:molybdenum cofactor cytidylyltransferase